MNVSTTKASATAAERMRAYRKRRRYGPWNVTVPLSDTDIDGLVRLKMLQQNERQDLVALQAAVMGVLYGALES